MPNRSYAVPEELAGARTDTALARLSGESRSVTAGWCAAGQVAQGGKPLQKADRVEAGDVLEVSGPDAPEVPAVVPEAVEGMGILHDDEDIVVIDKPAGVAAHPSPGWVGPTVVGALAAAGYRISTSGATERAGIVHRLDVGTSGAMVVAKTEHAYTVLKRAFKERTVEKVYHALVQGLPDPMEGTIDAPIGRHPAHDWRFAVLEGGRESVTHYRVLEAHGSASLLEVNLETGRTHQIRVHFSALRHPCAGDLTYGADPRLAAELGLTRQWLHAYRLGFDHPRSGDRIQCTSGYPQDLQYALDALSGGSDPAG